MPAFKYLSLQQLEANIVDLYLAKEMEKHKVDDIDELPGERKIQAEALMALLEKAENDTENPESVKSKALTAEILKIKRECTGILGTYFSRSPFVVYADQTIGNNEGYIFSASEERKLTIINTLYKNEIDKVTREKLELELQIIHLKSRPIKSLLQQQQLDLLCRIHDNFNNPIIVENTKLELRDLRNNELLSLFNEDEDNKLHDNLLLPAHRVRDARNKEIRQFDHKALSPTKTATMRSTAKVNLYLAQEDNVYMINAYDMELRKSRTRKVNPEFKSNEQDIDVLNRKLHDSINTAEYTGITNLFKQQQPQPPVQAENDVAADFVNVNHNSM